MIRRDVQLADGTAGWALISQIEHARISAQLAARCQGRFGPECPSVMRDEALAAIAHHDDGWAEWERAPRLDGRIGRPLSFMELPMADATAIWSKSIAVAEELGPLAAWMVSGHFLRLLEYSEHARHDRLAVEWAAETALRREPWLARWTAADPAVRTPAAAAEALQWLWAFDEVSLWFCCFCPARGESGARVDKSCRAGRTTPVEMELACVDDESGAATADPWRFDMTSIALAAPTLTVRATQYNGADDLLAGAVPGTMEWRLRRP